MARVEVTRLSKVYAKGGKPAVDDVSITVLDRELLVLLGPSGCGKSTLLRMIAGLEDATSGTIRIDGSVVNDVPPKDRDIAMVFQSYALYPHMSVYENMAFALTLRATPAAEIDRRVREAAVALGLEDKLASRPRQLSGGQMQRVALGRAIVRSPKVFLFDEPLSNLDAKLRAGMRVELKRLHRRLGATSIYVTHDQIEAMTLGDRVAVLKDGVLQQIGAPLDVYDRPANRFVAGFLGTPPMNFLTGRLEGVAGGSRFVCGGTAIDLSGAASLARAGGERIDVELGVRPEDIHVETWTPQAEGEAPPPEGGIPGTVDVAEPLGDQVVLYVDASASTVDRSLAQIVARAKPQSAPPAGARVLLRPDPARVHLFDRASGRSLASPAARP